MLFRIDDDINQIIDHLYQEVLGEFWPVERQWVENAYQGIDFPFEELPSEDLSMTANWSLDRLSGYLTTWSVVREYQDQKGHNPLNLIRDRLARAWGDSNLKRVLHWPLAVRTGRLSF